MKRLVASSILLGFGAVLALATLFPNGAQALPMFARKHEATCNTCHLAWPMLNATGRLYKENGYKFARGAEEGQKVSDYLIWDKQFPIATQLVARPYDKRESGDDKIRALHEVEIYVAGQVYKNVSGFFEMEAEDETGFDPEFPAATLGYHPFDFLNPRVAWAEITYTDPYDTFSSSRRLTRGRQSVIDKTFGGADNDGSLHDSRQNLFVSGRFLDRKLFFSLGYSGVADDPEGENPNNLSARLAWDITPQVTVGLFGVEGECEENDVDCNRDRDFSRYAVDAQADVSFAAGVVPGTLRLMGAYLEAEDDRDTTGEDENDALFVQALYAVQQDGRPTWVPLIRYDDYEEDDGRDDFEEITLNLTYYFTENIKGHVEWWRQLDVPSGLDRDGRITFQIFAAF